jgi:hypothetical protein
VLFGVDFPFALAKPTSALSNAELSWAVVAEPGSGGMLDCKWTGIAIAYQRRLAPAHCLGEN